MHHNDKKRRNAVQNLTVKKFFIIEFLLLCQQKRNWIGTSVKKSFSLNWLSFHIGQEKRKCDRKLSGTGSCHFKLSHFIDFWWYYDFRTVCVDSLKLEFNLFQIKFKFPNLANSQPIWTIDPLNWSWGDSKHTRAAKLID